MGGVRSTVKLRTFQCAMDWHKILKKKRESIAGDRSNFLSSIHPLNGDDCDGEESEGAGRGPQRTEGRKDGYSRVNRRPPVNKFLVAELESVGGDCFG